MHGKAMPLSDGTCHRELNCRRLFGHSGATKAEQTVTEKASCPQFYVWSSARVFTIQVGMLEVTSCRKWLFPWKCGDEKCDCWNGWIDRSKNKLSDKALENISGLLTAYKPLKKLCKKELYLKNEDRK
jgi:hypothetical protein